MNQYPVATKRVLWAILKATDLCVSNPNEIAKPLVDERVIARRDYALQTLSEVRYDRWREFNPDDAVRFYALCMHETGFIETNPNSIIADHELALRKPIASPTIQCCVRRPPIAPWLATTRWYRRKPQ